MPKGELLKKGKSCLERGVTILRGFSTRVTSVIRGQRIGLKTYNSIKKTENILGVKKNHLISVGYMLL
jgi:hypothetical protein